MGLLSKIFAAKAASSVVQRMNARNRVAPQGEYIPAGTSDTGLQASANAALSRAGQFYKENPKMVAGLGVAAALMALSALKRRQF